METVLLKQGVLGVAVLALAIWGWNRQKKVDELQDSRLKDAREMAKALDENSRVLEKLVNAVADYQRSR